MLCLSWRGPVLTREIPLLHQQSHDCLHYSHKLFRLALLRTQRCKFGIAMHNGSSLQVPVAVITVTCQNLLRPRLPCDRRCPFGRTQWGSRTPKIALLNETAIVSSCQNKRFELNINLHNESPWINMTKNEIMILLTRSGSFEIILSSLYLF